ncbi:MAG: hypothetical protein ABIQ31_00935 [Ferruginibacter sp.]
METKIDIAAELKTLSPLLAALNKVNVFTVPEGYFETISTTVLACLQHDVAEHEQAQEIPAGYFDQLAGSILNKIRTGETAKDEIRNLSPLLYGIHDKNVFEAPVGYFENVDKLIINKINTTGSRDELKEISPLLHSIQGKNVFEAPQGYFDGFAGIILKKVNLPTGKVVVMRKRNALMKYAVAAMIIGITALGINKYIDKPTIELPGKNMGAVATLDASVEKGKNMDDSQFNEALANLNGSDIARYLENNGDIADVALLNNNLQDVSLPSQDDYLLDETTLDKYLKEVEKTTVNN